MSIFEYDKEEEEKKLRKAEFEAGVEHGIEQSFSFTCNKENEKRKICRRNCGYARRNSEKIQNIYELARNMESRL